MCELIGCNFIRRVPHLLKLGSSIFMKILSKVVIKPPRFLYLQLCQKICKVRFICFELHRKGRWVERSDCGAPAQGQPQKGTGVTLSLTLMLLVANFSIQNDAKKS